MVNYFFEKKHVILCSHNEEEVELSPLSEETSMKIDEVPPNQSGSSQENREEKVGSFQFFMLLGLLFISVKSLIEFSYGFLLLLTEGKSDFGIFALIIIWVPGFISFVQFIVTYRQELPGYLVFVLAFGVVILYPVVPAIANVRLLYFLPKRDGVITQQFKNARYFLKSVKISFFLESSLQTVYLLWLGANGITSSKSSDNFISKIIDLSALTDLGLVFNIFSVLKSVIFMNVEVQASLIDEDTWNSIVTQIKLAIDYMPFQIVTCLFRIGSIVLIVTYLEFYSIIPFALVIILGIIINEYTLKEVGDEVPRYLMLVINIFSPVFINLDPRATRNVLSVQEKNLRCQTVANVMVYGTALIVILCLIKTLKMNGSIVINHEEFNWFVGTLLVTGLFSAALAFNQKTTVMLEDYGTTIKKSALVFVSTLKFTILFSLISTPIIMSKFVITKHKNSFVFHNKATTLLITEVFTIIPLNNNDHIQSVQKVAYLDNWNWTEIKSQTKDDGSAILIVGNNEAWRPSAPNPDFFNGETVKIPTFIVRYQDRKNIPRKNFKDLKVTSFKDLSTSYCNTLYNIYKSEYFS